MIIPIYMYCIPLVASQVEGQAMILGEEGWPIATAKGMQVRPVVALQDVAGRHF